MTKLVMPANGWRPRPYQQPLWDYFNDPITKAFDGTDKRAIEIAHRRWGKDDLSLHLMGKAGATRPATYWHMLPEYEQGRKAIWDAVNPHTGRRRIDEAFPEEWREQYNDRGMFLRFKWGATWQVVGSDNFQSLVGTPPAGIVLSEWSKAHPAAWAYLAPILVENHGWAVAITTPEGRNHAYEMLRVAQDDPKWFWDVCSIEDSIRIMRDAGLQPLITLEAVEAQRKEYHGMFGVEAGDALIEQEWFCSFQAAILGAYWGKEIGRLENSGNICTVDRVPGYPVHTAWDIGMDDPMAIWVFQAGPGWLHLIDYYESSGHGFDHYADWLGERDYVGGIDYVPHDAKQREPGALGGRTRIETLFALKRNPKLVPDHKPMDRINAVRRLLNRRDQRGNYITFLDEKRCAKGIEVARSYKADWDQKARTFKKSAKHDWASHGSDALGHLAVAVEFPTLRQMPSKPKAIEATPITVNQLLRNSRSPRERRWE